MLTLKKVLAEQNNLYGLCAERQLKTHEIFFGNAFYGMDRILKKYSDLPDKYPLKSSLFHGICFSYEYLWEAELKTPISVAYYYPEYRRKVYKNAFNKYGIKKNLLPIASPFLYALKLLEEQPKMSEKRGTIFFPQHSTGYVTVEMDFDDLAERLIKLDDEYKPITVCLYWKDFNLGRHIPFQKRGMQIVSAGHSFDPDFLFRFYHLCSKHHYAAGSGLGSHLFYSIKSGCSYFHLNSTNYHHSAKNEAMLKHDLAPPSRETDLMLKSLFSVPQPRTTPEQMKVVDYFLSADCLKSPLELRQELLDAEFLFREAKQPKVMVSLNQNDPKQKITDRQELKKEVKDNHNYVQIKQRPVVSICIPTFNGENFIIEAIYSALSQTYAHIEIIISDDGSSDATVELSKRILENSMVNFKILTHQQYGLAENWNFCISQARGKYIKFLFQDDLLEPNCIKEMVKLAEQNDEIGIIFSPRQVSIAKGFDYAVSVVESAYKEANDIHKSWSNLKLIQSGQELLIERNLLDDPINKIGEPSTVMIKKEVFEDVGGFNPELSQLVDLEMWLRILSKYKVGFIDKVLSEFRIHPQQKTRQNSASRKAILLDYQKFFDLITKDDRYPQRLREEAFCRYALLSDRQADIAQVRKQITEELLALPTSQIEASYKGVLGKMHKMLVREIRYKQPIAPEKDFVEELVKHLSDNLEKPKNLQYILAAMLYCRPEQLPLEYDLTKIPQWLFDDYLKFLLDSPIIYSEIGEADKYYSYIQQWVDSLHSSILGNPNSTIWQKVANEFSQNANFIPLYFNSANLKDIYVKRAEILEFFLKEKGHELDYEFGDRPLSRTKIRLGILASHFLPSAETFASLPVYEYISRDFEVILYSFRQTNAPVEEYCRSCANSFKQLPEKLQDQVNTIRADDLDLLFIGTNVTAVTNNVFLLSLHRLARVQTTSVASVVTTGVRNIDYYISGQLTDPQETAAEHYREKLVKLEGTAHCFSYGSEVQQATTRVNRELLDIPEEAVVFISGANFYKTIPELIDSWVKIIATVPNSILLLLPFGPNWTANYPKAAYIKHLKAWFLKQGVATDRLIVLDPQPVPNREDVKEYLKIADIYLDSYPFSGTTSLIEPLQVGLPVVARQGNCFRGAMGAAILHSLGVSNLVADSEESYIQLAISLGTNSELRKETGNQIRQKMSAQLSFLDSRAYSQKMGGLFEKLLRDYLADGLSENLRLRDTNLIMFPDWSCEEEELYNDFARVLKAIASHPEKDRMTLLVDTSNISEEDADMALSSMVMNLMMEEELDVEEGPDISLVSELSQIQWEALLSLVNGKIALECENREAIARVKADSIGAIELDSLGTC